MKENLKVIIIAGPKTNSSLYHKTLEKAGYDISYLLIKSKQKFKQALNENNWDIIISEYKLPKFTALSALEILNESGFNIPFIVVSSKKNNDTIVELIKKGASNFILKKNINTLSKIVKNEIAESKLKLKRTFVKKVISYPSPIHFKTLFENSPTPLWEEEYSELDKYLNKLKDKGIKDFRKYFDNKPSELLKCLSKIKIVDINKAALKLYKAKTKDELITNLDKIFTDNSLNIFKEELIAISKGKREFEAEVETKTLNDEKIFVLLQLKIDKYEKDQKRALIATTDITQRKKTETDRQSNLEFFKALELINQVIQGTEYLEQMMKDVLDTLLLVFNCDRAWLVYPCDPEASTWQVPMERTRPEYPGVLPIGVELPRDPAGAEVYRILRNNDGAVQFNPSSLNKVPKEMIKGFNVQSFIAMVFYPKVGKPWSFGLHQCSYPRVWNDDEIKLFEEIGRRISDGLTSLLNIKQP